jgi:excisionase family DNA binding protein
MRGMAEDQDETQDAAQDRVTIQEAAQRLGVKEDAVRKRIQRGSMRHEKAEDGRVYVWVDAAQDTTQDEPDTSRDEYRRQGPGRPGRGPPRAGGLPSSAARRGTGSAASG